MTPTPEASKRLFAMTEMEARLLVAFATSDQHVPLCCEPGEEWAHELVRRLITFRDRAAGTVQ